MKTRNALKTALAAVLAIGTIGGAYAASTAGKAGGEDATEIAAVMAAKTSLGDAVRLAEADAKGKAFEAGMEDDDGKTFYEVSTVTGDAVRELTIDPSSGKVLKSEEEGFLSKMIGHDKERAGFSAAKTGLADAIAAAEQAAGGKAIEAELDDEAAQPAFEVEVAVADGSLVQVTVDAISGKVTASGPVDETEEDDDD